MITPLPSKGDVVDVTLKGVRVDHVELPSGGFPAVVFVAVPGPDGGDNGTLRLPALSPAITTATVERVTPANWPPRVGDLWRDGDLDLWFATTAHVYQHGPGGDFPAVPVVELVPAGGGHAREPRDVNREYGPMQLVHREQDAPEPEPEGSWPPKVGEVWTDRDGDEWTVSAEPGGVSMYDDGGNGMSPEYVRTQWGPLTFTRREQPKDVS
ncbi:hypothetical protein AB0K05_24810 [Nonomuraea sp. NPDC049486]|uniref:hypothetical protein n=1 Tax=Nonomuraea sp. NPDC049486 TaxID=3155773 RepID=UPI00342593B3